MPPQLTVVKSEPLPSGTAVNEPAFRAWYARMAKEHDLNPDPDSPEQAYDYRAAFKAKAKPDASGHWPSDFKRAGHPNEVVGGFNTRTGERVPGTPRAKDAAELVSLGWDEATAARLAEMPDGELSVVKSEPLDESLFGGKPVTGREFAERMRTHDPLAGMDPRARTALGLGVGLAAGGPAALRAAGTAATVGGKVIKGAATLAAPVIKFEAVKQGLVMAHVPAPAAELIAAFVTGRQKGGKAAPAAKAEPVAEPAQFQSVPTYPRGGPTDVRPTVPTMGGVRPPAPDPTPAPAATAAPKPAPAPPPASVPPKAAKAVELTQKMRNDNGIAVRRAAKAANANFTDKELKAAGELADQGLSPVEAVLQIKRAQEAAAGLSAAEKLAQMPGAMTEAQMRAEIAARVGNQSPRR